MCFSNCCCYNVCSFYEYFKANQFKLCFSSTTKLWFHWVTLCFILPGNNQQPQPVPEPWQGQKLARIFCLDTNWLKSVLQLQKCWSFTIHEKRFTREAFLNYLRINSSLTIFYTYEYPLKSLWFTSNHRWKNVENCLLFFATLESVEGLQGVWSMSFWKVLSALLLSLVTSLSFHYKRH